MREPFKPVPLRPAVTTQYLRHLQSAVSRATTVNPLAGAPGMVDDDGSGLGISLDQVDFLFVKLTQAPSSSSDPMYGGTAVDADTHLLFTPGAGFTTATPGLTFDNSTSPVQNPIYEINGRTDISLNQYVIVVRGYVRSDGTQEWLFSAPGAVSNVKIIRISDGFVDDGNWKYWCGVIEEDFDPTASPPWIDTASTLLTPSGGILFSGKAINCWVVDWYDYGTLTIGFDGGSAVTAIYQNKSFDPTGTGTYLLPVYATTHYRADITVTCQDDGSGNQIPVGQLGG